MSWFGHVHRRDDDNASKSVLATQFEGSRHRGISKPEVDMKQNKICPEWASDQPVVEAVIVGVNIVCGLIKSSQYWFGLVGLRFFT